MKIRVKHVVFGGVACLLFLAAWIIGCSDKSQTPVEPKEYFVYFADQSSPNHYFRYHTGTGEIDWFYLPYNSIESGFGISPDGRKMYLSPANAGLIAEIDLDSHVVIAEHPISISEHPAAGWGRDVQVSPDGRYIAIVNRYLYIIDMAGYRVIYSDTIYDYLHGRFMSDGSVFLCAGQSKDYMESFILEVEIGPNVVGTKRPFPAGWPTRVIPDADNNRWYVLSVMGGEYWRFTVYDQVSDSVVFSKGFLPGAGDLEMTPDERFVIYTQSGLPNGDIPPPPYFTIYSIFTNCIERQVDAVGIDTLMEVYPLGELAVTPDGRHLIGIGTVGGGIYDYDIRRGVFNKHVYSGEPIFGWTFSLVCQSRP